MECRDCVTRYLRSKVTKIISYAQNDICVETQLFYDCYKSITIVEQDNLYNFGFKQFFILLTVFKIEREEWGCKDTSRI